MEVLSNLLHSLSEAIQIVQQQVDQIVERERRVEATQERRIETEQERHPTTSSSANEESRETTRTSDSETDTVQTSETSSDVTAQSSRSTQVEPSRTQETTSEEDDDPYEIEELLEYIRSLGSVADPIASDIISTRSARIRSPPATGGERSSVSTANTVEALEWDVITARVAPSEENLLASINSPALVANPIVTEMTTNNDDLPTAVAVDN